MNADHNGANIANNNGAKTASPPSISTFTNIQSSDSSTLVKQQDPLRKKNKDFNILLRFQDHYGETGCCDSLPILVEIVRLVRSGKLVLPREARKLAADFSCIAEIVPIQVASLSRQLEEIERKKLELSIDQSISLDESIGILIDPIERLLDIARDYPDLAVPGEIEGTSTAFIPTDKLLNDLYYNLSYLKEHTRRDRLLVEVKRKTDSSFYIRRLTSILGDTRNIIGQLLKRLQCNISHYVPRLSQQ
jgi:hypothetical protein